MRRCCTRPQPCSLAEAPDEAYLDRRIREETAGGADLVLLRTLSP
jgi:hypothetical protein